jgi:CheY-like chemotaxis protein
VVGAGTTFHVYLPACGNSPAGAPTSQIATPQRSLKILMMDDDEALRNGIKSALQGMGHEVELAEDGQRAVEDFVNAQEPWRPFDLVILDLTVRGGSGGLEALRALLKINPAMKAIAMSGDANHPAMLNHEQHGFKAALTKPFNREELAKVLARIL